MPPLTTSAGVSPPRSQICSGLAPNAAPGMGEARAPRLSFSARPCPTWRPIRPKASSAYRALEANRHVCRRWRIGGCPNPSPKRQPPPVTDPARTSPVGATTSASLFLCCSGIQRQGGTCCKLYSEPLSLFFTGRSRSRWAKGIPTTANLSHSHRKRATSRVIRWSSPNLQAPGAGAGRWRSGPVRFHRDLRISTSFY